MFKKWMAFLCVAVLLLSVGLPTFAAKDGVLPWHEEKTLLEQIMERDGFLDGIWYPWLFNGSGGANLTANDTMTLYYGAQWSEAAIDVKGADLVYRSVYNLKAMGYNMVAYAGSAFAEGVVFDDNFDVVGIKEDYLVNVRRLLDIFREVKMPILWTVYFHSSSSPQYHGIDGWHRITQMIANPQVADHYAERFVRPLCKVLAEYPDVVAMVAIADEPENEINDSDIGNHFDGDRAHYGTTQEKYAYFLSAINEVVMEELPSVPRTMAANSDNLSLHGPLNLDLAGRNRYDAGGSVAQMSYYRVDSPMILAEYNYPDASKIDDDIYTQTLVNFRKNMTDKGYMGGFQWCFLPDNFDGAHYLQKKGGKSETDFRSTVYDLYYYMTDYRNEYRGVETVLDTPSLFCNDGSGKVQWIPARQASAMDLLRSTDDGKTWEKLLDNVDPALYTDVDGKGVYTDITAPKSGYMYKIVVRDGKGNEVESTPSNKAGADLAHRREMIPSGVQIGDLGKDKLPRVTKDVAKLISFGAINNRPHTAADNLIVNGSFEEIAGGQWNKDTFLNTSIRVVEDASTRFGNKSLYFDTSAIDEETWYSFTVEVEPNTDYVFSTWVKGAYMADDNKAHSSIGVVDPDTGKYMVYWEYYRDYARSSRLNQQIYPTSWDNEWHLRSVVFNSGEQTQITIALCGYGSKMWVDDLALYKNTEGVKYVSPNLRANAKPYFDFAYSSCDPEDSLTGNVNMEETDSDYWQTGIAWKNGFLQMVDSDSEHGGVMQYTASEETWGFYYTKWIDVKPNTNYIFSADIKVLENGAGRIGLVNGRKNGPQSIVEFDFNTDFFGEDWFSVVMAFNTDAFTRIGIIVVDDGGAAWLDNIRFFEAENGSAYEDDFFGWHETEDGWMYYQNHYPAISKWIKSDGGWYYLDESGYMVSNQWRKDSNGWCYLTESGKMATNMWIKDSVGWCYVGTNGYCVTNTWKRDSKGWCYLDKDGRMATNKWVKDSVGWCYVGADGYAVTNTWKKDSVGWCYLNSSGSMTKSAWVKTDDKWYYLDVNGYMVTNAWKKDSVGWVYLGSNGAMLTNAWCKDSKGWCYVGANGYAVINCWKKDSRGWIWLDKNGSMTKSAWVQDGGKWYYLDAEGYMVANTTLTIGSTKYTFNASGVWVK